MPVTPTYPGVYIEEIPSGVRTITGVATSITAFIGRALRGPVNKAVTINNFGDFERSFGGLWVESTLSYAVRDFYLNGGSQAIIVRLYHAEEGDEAKPTKAKLSVNGLTLEAAYPGAWGNNLRVRVDHDVSAAAAERYELEEADLFNLAVHDTKTGATELFRNVSVIPSPRLVDKVLENESNLARVLSPLPESRPAAHPDPQPGEDVWGDNDPATNSKVAEADQASDGEMLNVNDFTGPGKEDAKEGLYALKQADLFNLLCIPPYLARGDVDSSLISTAATYCEDRRAMLLVDAPSSWTDKDKAKTGIEAGVGTTSKNAALFFPRLRQPNPLRDSQKEDFAPCGTVAGVFARTDAQRGVWKAPAGLEATLRGVPQLSVPLTNEENGELNPLGINCLRAMPPAGRVIWGSRTLQGDDRLASEWKYIPVRRLALYIEESLYRGTQWVVFEPNDEPLWAQIRLNVGAFMHNLFRQGAFQGSTPREAYFVKCDKETTTQNDINLGIVNIVVGFAPLKPAEFVIIKIQQMAGQIEA
jgi:phage tail sheath protein FI